MTDARKINNKQREVFKDRPSDRDLEIYRRNRVELVPMRKVAKEYGLAPSRIAAIVTAVEPWVLEKLPRDVEAVRTRHEQILSRMAEEAAEQWERSKLDAETMTASNETAAEGASRTKTEKRKQGRYGDPRFIEQIRGCLNDIREMWGDNAPKKEERGSPGEFESRETVYGRVAAKLEKLIQPQEN